MAPPSVTETLVLIQRRNGTLWGTELFTVSITVVESNRWMKTDEKRSEEPIIGKRVYEGFTNKRGCRRGQKTEYGKETIRRTTDSEG